MARGCVFDLQGEWSGEWGLRKPGQERLDRGSVLPNTGGRSRRALKPEAFGPIGSLVLPNTGGRSRRAPKPEELRPIASLVLPNTTWHEQACHALLAGWSTAGAGGGPPGGVSRGCWGFGFGVGGLPPAFLRLLGAPH